MSRSSTMQRLLCVLAMLALWAGCAQEESPTAIVLYVDGDLDLTRVSGIAYRVFAADGDGGATGGSTQPVTGPADLPQTVVLLKGKAARVRVEVSALGAAGSPILTQRAYVTFRPRETVSTPITLAQTCLEITACKETESCTLDATGAVACESIKEAPTKLVDKPGDERSWEAGVFTPSSPRDAGVRDAASLPADAQAVPFEDGGSASDASAEPVDAAPRCERSRGECNVVSGCGCEGKAGTHCQSLEGQGPTCVVLSGSVARNQRCDANDECAQGLACVGSVCRKYCVGAEDCDGDCVPASSTIVEKVCIERCKLGEKCGEMGVDCVQREGDVNEGRCLFAREDCARNNKICEEPVRGNGTCAHGTDAVDCCPGRKGDCDLVDSCGCREAQACQLSRTDRSDDARCAGPGLKFRGFTCSAQAECAKGLGCFAGMCAEYCRADGDCEAGGKCTQLSDLGVAFCRYPCNVGMQRAAECGPGTVCMGPANNAFCTVPI